MVNTENWKSERIPLLPWSLPLLWVYTPSSFSNPPTLGDKKMGSCQEAGEAWEEANEDDGSKN